ncbi:phosphoribosylanthranilate isomerase [Deferribacter desulfuricans SSM1]|uniref:N-(5'-phosphoribosyl)anthranilate isomerase n=1 Tax=Deferribacter desulfuricans (strain DSM 14783 / JCM 11476 / NBRC 101012 / SSM1) TaxID=639282 RepID=D3PBG3_DEFDS|nr:phosphoribosylanthranilate isomerase [Deferribacter desulfuricans]BAI79936.1 phosphoribosylanthranilate isomerase [Deferribacter desulfuricans SSM1]
MFIKVCGITTFEQIEWAIELGYSAVGIVFHPKSKRYVGYTKGIKLADYAKNKILTVCVGIDFDEVKDVYDNFDYVQLYNYRELDNLIYGTADKPDNEKFKYLIFDRSMGKGVFECDYPEWVYDYTDRLLVSGGLTPENVGNVFEKIIPAGVDVSSGVEVDYGVKSFEKMKLFIEKIKQHI